MSLTVTEMVAKLGLDIDEGEFDKGDRLVEGLKAGLMGLAGVATAAAAALGALVAKTVASASAADDASQATGISADALQELGHAAQLSGSSADEVQGALMRLSRAAGDAARGSAESAAGFARLGVSVRSTSGAVKTADVLLGELADAIARLPEAERAAAAVDVFGQSGARLVPLLSQGRDGIAALRKEARDLGVVLDSDTIAAAADLGDTFDRVAASARGLGYVVAGPLLAPLRRAGEAMVRWWMANQALIRQRVDAFWRVMLPVLQAVGTALLAIGDAVVAGIEHWRDLAVVLGGAVLAALMANASALTWSAGLYAVVALQAVAAAVAAAAAWVMAALPFIFLGTVLALVIDDIYEFATGGESLISDFAYAVVELFTMLKDAVVGVFTDVFEWIGALFEKIFDRIFKGIDRVVQLAEKVGGAIGGAVGGLFADDTVEVLARGVSDAATSPGGVSGLFGGGASPAASSSLSTTSRSVQVNAPVEVRIAAAPGQSPDAIARAAGGVLSSSFERILSDAAATGGA